MNSPPGHDKGRTGVVTGIDSGASPFAYAQVDGLGEVTFSLKRKYKVWEEKVWPTKGVSVMLFDIREHAKGWRAYKARFVRPEDRR